MVESLHALSREHLIVAAHRGVFGGNIPCNTLTAYEIALKQGADMIETDISVCGDGTLVVFHPRMEQRQLGFQGDITQMPWEEVKQLRYCNSDRTPTQFGIITLDALLETFRGRCFINIDKFWEDPAAISQAIRRHNMQDQVLVKSPPTEQVVQVLEQIAPDIPYMPVIKTPDFPHELLLQRKIRYVGVEVVFDQEDSPLASPAFIGKLQKDGLLVWVNSIIYNHKKQLSGGHSDDTAFTVSPDYGWGWLVQRGFDIIQTDWTGMLVDYLKESKQYYR